MNACGWSLDYFLGMREPCEMMPVDHHWHLFRVPQTLIFLLSSR